MHKKFNEEKYQNGGSATPFIRIVYRTLYFRAIIVEGDYGSGHEGCEGYGDGQDEGVGDRECEGNSFSDFEFCIEEEACTGEDTNDDDNNLYRLFQTPPPPEEVY